MLKDNHLIGKDKNKFEKFFFELRIKHSFRR